MIPNKATDSYVNSSYFQRIRDAVDDIYKRTSATVPFKGGVSSINPNDLYRKVALALLEEGILDNLGTKFEPIYIWKSSVPLVESVYHRVYKKVREISRKYYDTLKEKKEETVKEKKEEKKETSKPADISSFGDQELWDELKNRGFTIVSGVLSKVITLN